jgi:hypothetical protein
MDRWEGVGRLYFEVAHSLFRESPPPHAFPGKSEETDQFGVLQNPCVRDDERADDRGGRVYANQSF